MVVNKGKDRVAVGISGGVDSSVAAALLIEQGYDVVGVHMTCFDEDVPYCTATEDKEFAIRVAARLNIPLRIYDFRKEYKERVIDYMVREYQANRTPNPDVVCNREIKFGLLFDKVFDELRVNYLATGHYARIGRARSKLKSQNSKPQLKSKKLDSVSNLGFRSSNLRVGEHYLVQGADASKDQSYFLYSLTPTQLQRVLFPVGDLMKSEVRGLAVKFNLPTQDRQDSQGLCFVGQVGAAEFLSDKVDSVPGEVVTSGGRVVGIHRGLPFYTIGQRHGFELEEYFENVMYVIGKIPEKNQLIVGTKPQLKVKQFGVVIDNWIKPPGLRGDNPGGCRKIKCRVRIRHLGGLYPCRIEASSLPRYSELSSEYDLNEILSQVQDDNPRGNDNIEKQVSVHLDNPVEAVAPGQVAVFYDGERVLGGGVIAEGIYGGQVQTVSDP